MNNLLENIVDRSALLLALKAKQDGLEQSKLSSLIPSWKEHLKSLSRLKIDIDVIGSVVRLKTKISYDLYQSIPPEIRNDVENKLWKLIDKEPIIDPLQLEFPIYKPKTIAKSADSNNCINCADPPCMTYGLDNFGGVDKFPSRVCPSDIIKHDDNGLLQINDVDCTGCLLCVIRCPINAIKLSDVATLNKYNKKDIGSEVELLSLPSNERKHLTDELLTKFGNSTKNFLLDDIKTTLDNFDDKVSNLELNWDRDKYYIFVRNVFRELGLETSYTGSGGMLKRADVTIIKPFVVGIEVKSPAESDIGVNAVRQSFDARLEVMETYQTKEAYCAAVGQDISRGSHKRTLGYFATGVNIPLLRGRYLLYILMKHLTILPQDANSDLKRLFTNYNGWFGKEELASYFNNYFELRISEINNGKITLPFPINTNISSKSKDEIIAELKTLQKETIDEIERCFPDPERKARGDIPRRFGCSISRLHSQSTCQYGNSS